MNRRLLRAIASITLSMAVMGLVAYGFGRLSRTAWVWWLAPLTVALEGSLLFRARGRGSAAVLSLSELSVFGDLGVPLYVVSSAVAAGVAAWAAYSGNRLVLIIGAACAIFGMAFERPDEPAFEHTTRQHGYSLRPASAIFQGAIAFHRRRALHDGKSPSPSGRPLAVGRRRRAENQPYQHQSYW